MTSIIEKILAEHPDLEDDEKHQISDYLAYLRVKRNMRRLAEPVTSAAVLELEVSPSTYDEIKSKSGIHQPVTDKFAMSFQRVVFTRKLDTAQLWRRRGDPSTRFLLLGRGFLMTQSWGTAPDTDCTIVQVYPDGQRYIVSTQDFITLFTEVEP